MSVAPHHPPAYCRSLLLFLSTPAHILLKAMLAQQRVVSARGRAAPRGRYVSMLHVRSENFCVHRLGSIHQ